MRATSSSPRSSLVLYGSETGNAEDVAMELSRVVERLHFSSHVIPLDAVDPSSLHDFTIILVALCTTGQGDLPAGSRNFWSKLLRKKLSSTHLQHVHFAVFGLGDRSYPRYNWAAKKLNKRLLQLGAKPILVLGEGDEQQVEGYDTALLPWLAELGQRILEQYPLPAGLDPIPHEVLLPPRSILELRFLDVGTEPLPTTKHGGQQVQQLQQVPQDGGNSSSRMNGNIFDSEQPTSPARIDLTLTSNRRLTPTNHWQDVRHLVFSSQGRLNYSPGDTVTIYPQNDAEDVNQVVRLMAWDDVADLPLAIRTKEPNSALWPFDGSQSDTLTLKELLAKHLDINGIPRRSFFSLILHFTEDSFQKTRLLEFANPAFIDELYDYTTRPRRSIIEVLQEFDSVKIPWQWALHVFPLLRGRQFSIASGGVLKHPHENSTTFELLVAMVKYQTVIRKLRRGVCTRYLDSMAPGSLLQVSLQQGGLGSTIYDPLRPVVLIGPGTGVAPIRSVIWERCARIDERSNSHKELSNGHNSSSKTTQPLAETVLFFGNRNESADFFFRDEWEDLRSKMPLRIFAAFSRDQRPLRYVQDTMLDQRELVFRLLHDEKGIVFLCGSSGKMPKAVRAVLVDIFASSAAMDQDAAMAYLKKMENDGRYLQETW